MKLWFTLSILLTQITGFAMEIPVSQVLFPEKGFDNNDNVELVLDGNLPNKCTQLGETKVLIDKATRNIVVTQLAELRDIPDCKPTTTSAKIPQQKYPIPFTKVVGLGHLLVGEYTVVYRNSLGLSMKTLTIDETHVNTIDQINYAYISDAFIPAINKVGKELTLILTGVVFNSCEVFDPQVKVERVGDVFIVLPKVNPTGERDCFYAQKPIQGIVKLGKVDHGGRFLVHIRSSTGVSLNKVFSVVDQDGIDGFR